MRLAVRGPRILDFDIENRPLSYWIPDRPSAEITAIAWKFVNERYAMRCHLLYGPDGPLGDGANVMFEKFVEAYNAADMVTGHYIVMHDLPIINGALLELGYPSLEQKLVSDTKVHLLRKKDIPVTQENLSAMLGVKAPKIHVSQEDWRDANRLTPEGLRKTRRRVTGDVRQHMEMRAALLERGWLGPPKMWRP